MEISRKSNDIIDYSLTIFLLNLAGNIISAVVQIIIRKWYFIFPQIIVSAILFFIVSFFFSFMRTDFYGADKEIPKNAQCEVPLKEAAKESEINSNDFKLQGGYDHCSYYVQK